MKEYMIFMDVSGDIDLPFVTSNGIRFIPMHYAMDDENRVYTGEETKDQIDSFYDELKLGKSAKTTQINPYTYEEIFAPFMKEGYSILYLCLSSGLSSTFQSATIASQTLKDKFPEVDLVPVDTLLATAGMGILLEKACQNKNLGMDIMANKDDLDYFKSKIHVNAFVNDLNFLKRGGRISPTVAVIGSLLSIKPMIEILPDGKLDIVAKLKGSRKAMKFMENLYAEIGKLDSSIPVFISDASNESDAEILKEQILAINPNAQIKLNKLSPIIGVHLGPGSIVIGYESK